ncbi:hypothetical protein BDZ97DRAFT_1948360 [Flammula alnicola]|nr:hypothetical protein BDZ97DRAFT_1948360 [Flammula alnicola]
MIPKHKKGEAWKLLHASAFTLYLNEPSSEKNRKITMSQDWKGAKVTPGSSGAGGGPGGAVGSHNENTTDIQNSHNDNSVRQHVEGDNYKHPVDQGDQFNGAISDSAVGGRENKNILHNDGPASGSEALTSSREAEINEKLARARERLAAKKEKERLDRMEAELKRLELELDD